MGPPDEKHPPDTAVPDPESVETPEGDAHSALSDQVYEIGSKVGIVASVAKEPAKTKDEYALRRNAVSTALINFRAQVKHFEQAVKEAIRPPAK